MISQDLDALWAEMQEATGQWLDHLEPCEEQALRKVLAKALRQAVTRGVEEAQDREINHFISQHGDSVLSKFSITSLRQAVDKKRAE